MYINLLKIILSIFLDVSKIPVCDKAAHIEFPAEIEKINLSDKLGTNVGIL